MRNNSYLNKNPLVPHWISPGQRQGSAGFEALPWGARVTRGSRAGHARTAARRTDRADACTTAARIDSDSSLSA